jgi:hypothetical protein
VTRRQWAGRAAWALATWAVLSAYAEWSGREPHILLLGGVVLAGFTVGWLVADLGQLTAPAPWEMAQPFQPHQRGNDSRFSRLSQALSDATDRQQVAADVHAILVRLVDDLLSTRHGIDRRRDPEAARRLMGEPLTGYVESPPAARQVNDRRYLSGVLDEMESL